jgi:hypothetical protein
MRKLFEVTLACATLIGLAALVATPVEAKDKPAKKDEKPKKDKPKPKPKAADKPKPKVADKSKPKVHDKPKPKVVDKTKEKVHDKSKTKVVDKTKEKVHDKSKTKVVDKTKTKVNEKTTVNKQGNVRTTTNTRTAGTDSRTATSRATASGGKPAGGKPAPASGNIHAPIYDALALLHEANHNAKSAPKTNNRFGGHRNKAVDQMNRAISQLKNSLKHVKAPLPGGPGNITTSSVPMHHALKKAREALDSANAAPHTDNIYGGHRNKAVAHLDHAIKQLHEGIKYYEAHPTK